MRVKAGAIKSAPIPTGVRPGKLGPEDDNQPIGFFLPQHIMSNEPLILTHHMQNHV